MSIFKETFPSFVKNQLKLREEILRYKRPSTFIDNDILDGNEHFFINHAQRQCTIRLSSGVDIHDQTLLETHEKGKPTQKTAKDWVLQGGIVSDGTHKSGFTGDDGAYGGKNTRSDNSADGFGIVPMPGIIDAEIATKSAYGSLRSAKVKFVCHNRRQLEILELLYMRPGYTLLLEWGWNYYNNWVGNDKIEKINLGNRLEVYNLFWNKQTRQHEMEKAIEISKKETQGNYDALIGYCKNFTYKSRGDGGYDCETEIIAKGEILESLKASEKDFDTFRDDSEEKKELETMHPMQQILEHLTSYGDAIKDRNDMGYDSDVTMGDNDKGFIPLKKKLRALIWENSRPDGRSGGIPSSGGLFPYIISKDTVFVNYSGRGGIHSQAYDPSKLRQDADADGWADNLFMTTYVRWDALCAMINNFALPKDDKNQPLFSLNTCDISNSRHGIFYGEGKGAGPWIMPLQMSFGLKDVDDLRNKITHVDVKQETSWYSFGGYDEGSAKLNWDLFDMSLNSSVVRMPVDIWYSHKANTGVTNGSIWKSKKYKNNFRPMTSKIWDRSICSTDPHKTNRTFSQHQDIDFTSNEVIRNIGNIYLGCEHLMYTFKQMYYDSDNNPKESFTLFKFLEKVWKNVNDNVGPTHDFALNVAHDMKDIVRVIDQNVDSKEIDFDNIHELNIQGMDSVFRDFTYNTSIPSSLTATIAIAAQSPDSIDDLDSVTFAAINKGIKDRFAKGESFDPDNPTKDQRTKWKKRFDKHLKYLWKAIHMRENYNAFINKFWEQKEGVLMMHYRRFEWESYQNTYNFGEYDELTSSDATSRNKGAKSQLWKAIRYFRSVYGGDGRHDGKNYYKGQPRRSLTNQRISSIIPLKFNGTLDGISGIKIGNVFKIRPDRLPIGYQSKDVHFIVMGESQKVTAGQDWTTEIKGNLILLAKESLSDDGWKNSYKDSNQTVSKASVNSPTFEEYKKHTPTKIKKPVVHGSDPYTLHSIGDGIALGNPMPGYNDSLTPERKHKFDPSTDGWTGRKYGNTKRNREKNRVGQFRPHNGNDIHTRKHTFYWDGNIHESSGTESRVSGYSKFSKATPILAPADGVVGDWRSNPDGYGRYLDLVHDNGYETRYGHVQAVFLKKGDRFIRGQVVGASGGGTGNKAFDGNSTGPHIHYEITKGGPGKNYENPFHHLISGGGATKQDYDDLFNPTL